MPRQTTRTRDTSGNARRFRTPRASRARASVSGRASRRLRGPRRKTQPARRIYIRGGPCSECPSVVMVHGHFLELDVFQATDIDGGCRHAFRVDTLAERQHAAMPAEAVFDDVFV